MGGLYPYPGQNPELEQQAQAERLRDAEERAREEQLADEIRPRWWTRVRRSFQRRRSPNPAGDHG
jgi:hypothetical protein